MGLSLLHFRTAVIFALIGAGLAIWMAATHDFRAIPAEVALNVLGWASFMVYGLYYRVMQGAPGRQDRGGGLERLHYFVALIGVAVAAIGIAGTEWGHPLFDPFRVIGALIVAFGFLLFAVIVFRPRSA
jgi:hypothetical protein